MLSTNPMAALFGKSPFKPLQQHMCVVIECVAEVQPLFQALIDDDQEQLEERKNRIFLKEREADAIKNDICDHLPKRLLLAVDRQDLLELLAMQDAIADTAQDIAGLLVERRMELLSGMDELLETGFRGREVKRVEAMVVELGNMESDTDVMGMALTRALFSEEEKLKPLSVMFWYQLIQWVGNLADHAERVGDRLRLLIAR